MAGSCSCSITPYEDDLDDSTKDTIIKWSHDDHDGDGDGPSGEVTYNEVDVPHPKRIRLSDLIERFIPQKLDWEFKHTRTRWLWLREREIPVKLVALMNLQGWYTIFLWPFFGKPRCLSRYSLNRIRFWLYISFFFFFFLFISFAFLFLNRAWVILLLIQQQN